VRADELTNLKRHGYQRLRPKIDAIKSGFWLFDLSARLRALQGCDFGLACLCDPAIRWHYHFRWSVSRSFAESHMFDALIGEDVDGSIVIYGYFVRACSSCQNNRVLQLTEPKKGSLLLIILPGRSLLNAPVPCFEYLCRFAGASGLRRTRLSRHGI
jgi:hypothetical protein